jgi:hypothetical protein
VKFWSASGRAYPLLLRQLHMALLAAVQSQSEFNVQRPPKNRRHDGSDTAVQHLIETACLGRLCNEAL